MDEVCFNRLFLIYIYTGAWKTMEHTFQRNIHSADLRCIFLLVSPLWIMDVSQNDDGPNMPHISLMHYLHLKSFQTTLLITF